MKGGEIYDPVMQKITLIIIIMICIIMISHYDFQYNDYRIARVWYSYIIMTIIIIRPSPGRTLHSLACAGMIIIITIILQ